MPADDRVDPAVNAEDELVHVSQLHSGWHENWWLTYSDPLSDIQGVVYASHHTARRSFVRAFATVAGEPLFTFSERAHFDVAFAEAHSVVGPAQFTCVTPFGDWIYRFAHGDVSVELRWSALIPAYQWDWVTEPNSQHVEQ